MKKNKSIAILMATYNGEKYLKEQLESIINQTYYNWTLYIQDDGSKDKTLEIIKEYEKKDSRVKHFDIGLTRQGAGQNFMSMLNAIDSNYYMFADQDDVWFPDKIEKTFKRMKEEEGKNPDKPIIVHTSRCHTDADLNVKLENEFNPKKLPLETIRKKIDKLKHPDILRIYTIVGGCTMMLNKKVKEIVFPCIHLRVHDSICAMAVANNDGVISSILEPTMYYRIHSSNTCGVSSNKILPKIMRPIRTIKANLKGYPIWKVYGGGTFSKFLYYRIKYFLILRMN